MPITGSVDIIKGASYSRDRTGVTRNMVYFVEGLGGPGISDILVQAVENAGKIPSYGTPHPSRSGLFVTNITAIPFPDGSQSSAKVTVTYSPPEYLPNQWKVRIGNSQQQLQTSYDFAGNVLEIDYTTSGPLAVSTFQIAKVPVLVSGTILEFSSLITLPILNTWGAAADLVNSNIWQRGVKRSWLCKGISNAESQESLGLFQASISFEYLRIGGESAWDTVAFWDDNRMKRVPRDAQLDFNANGATADSGKGWRRCKPQGEMNFASLNLPIIFS